MTTLKKARKKGNWPSSLKSISATQKGYSTAFNATLKAMAGKSKSVPAASSKRNPDD
jgi:hypothetical protein